MSDETKYYIGAAAEFIKDYSRLPVLLNATRNLSVNSAILHEEAVSRFLSFYLVGYEEYENYENMDSFLLAGMKIYNDVHLVGPIIHSAFINSMKLNGELFNEDAFKKSLVDKKSTYFNLALFDVMSVSLADCRHALSRRSKFQVFNYRTIIEKSEENKKEFKSKMIDLLNNKEFSQAIDRWNYNNPSSIKDRFEIFHENMKDFAKDIEEEENEINKNYYDRTP